jgi:uncharacterized protein
MMFDPVLLAITVVFMLIGMFVSNRLKSKFSEYAQVNLASGLSGRDVAEKMLRDNQIYDVKVTSVEGFLTDHYNPAEKTINLSPDVYNGRTISSAAVAAHECGHAVQHAVGYQWLALRSRLVPVVNISSTLMNVVLLIMGLLTFASPHFGNTALIIIIVLQAVLAFFAVITLPVEFDASRRGLAWLESANITYGEEKAKAKDALTWAGLTYFVAAIAAIATLLYFITRYMGSNRD